MSDGQPRCNQTSDSTFNKVNQIETNKRLEWLNRVIDTLDDIYMQLSVDNQTIWNEIIVKNKCPTYMEYELGMNRATMFRKRKQIAYICATELGMLSQKS